VVVAVALELAQQETQILKEDLVVVLAVIELLVMGHPHYEDQH
jgi:hypothetical protein